MPRLLRRLFSALRPAEDTSLRGLRLDDRTCCFDQDRARETRRRLREEVEAWRL